MKKINIPQERLKDYKEFLEEDYNKWTKGDPNYGGFLVEFEIGSKYIKVIASDKNGNGKHVHSFIVNKADKFPVGTILKAASWKAPAVNFARGNVLAEIMQAPNCSIRWSGIV